MNNNSVLNKLNNNSDGMNYNNNDLVSNSYYNNDRGTNRSLECKKIFNFFELKINFRCE